MGGGAGLGGAAVWDATHDGAPGSPNASAASTTSTVANQTQSPPADGSVDGYAVMQALIARGVIGDYRAGDGSAAEPHLLRFGFTPLYTRFQDVFDAVEALAEVLARGEWREERFTRKSAVT